VKLEELKVYQSSMDLGDIITKKQKTLAIIQELLFMKQKHG